MENEVKTYWVEFYDEVGNYQKIEVHEADKRSAVQRVIEQYGRKVKIIYVS